MVRRYVRQPERLIMLSLVFTTLALAAQQPDSATPADKDFLPAGPFLFEPGTIHPTYMDAFDDRPVVKSPDGKLGVTVTGPKESYAFDDQPVVISPDGKLGVTVTGPKEPYGAWVTISHSTFPDGPVQVWPIQASVDVLWRPDSQAFALTDNRYADLSYVFVCVTELRTGKSGTGLDFRITDLTPIVRKAFEESAGKYYEPSNYDNYDNYDTLLFYAKVLRWIGNDELLVGVSARTSGPATFPNQGLKEWDFAYLVDVPNGRVAREVGKDQLLSEYKVKVPY
jgi:hypothetical protein